LGCLLIFETFLGDLWRLTPGETLRQLSLAIALLFPSPLHAASLSPDLQRKLVPVLPDSLHSSERIVYLLIGLVFSRVQRSLVVPSIPIGFVLFCLAKRLSPWSLFQVSA